MVITETHRVPEMSSLTHTPDCWANKDRNASGFLVAELDHFPNGMKPVADYVHSKGLDFGLYTCAGTHTCVGGRPGSKGHWSEDANVFAEWGIDWVKQDNCNTDGMGKPEDYYKNMSMALNETGRAMCFAMCEWGKDGPWKWGGGIAQSWRMSGDHTGVWSSTKSIIAQSAAIPAEYSGKPYGWNDMDMLETGNYAQAAHANGRESNMSATEYKTEFSLWAISASPLVVTTPIMNCSAGSPSINAPSWLDTAAPCKVGLKKQLSHAPCHEGTSYGCAGNSTMWTDKGCRGTFVVDGSYVSCDTDRAGRHYCAPLSCVPHITELQKEILLNKEIIAINQDITPQGRPVMEGDLTVWARGLTGGDVAVALYNEDDTAKAIGFKLSAVGAPATASIRDLWEHEELGKFTDTFPSVSVEAHGTVVLRLTKA